MVPEAMRILKEAKVLETWEDGARGYDEDGWSQAQALDPAAVLALDADAVCDCEAIILWLSDYQWINVQSQGAGPASSASRCRHW